MSCIDMDKVKRGIASYLWDRIEMIISGKFSDASEEQQRHYLQLADGVIEYYIKPLIAPAQLADSER